MKHCFTLIFAFLLSTGVYAQFCIPSYNSGTTDGDSIVSMTLGTFSANYPASAIGYSDYTGLATIGLTAGAPYSLTVQNNPQWSSTVEAWIDFDDDSIFTLAEKLGQVGIL